MPDGKNSAKAVQIGDWLLFPELNLLRQADREASREEPREKLREVRLEPRHADLLLFLSTRRGDVVSTDELVEHVWQRQVVSDQSVYQAIAKLRKAFGDRASQPRYIETVAKRGYRLITEVSEAPPDAAEDRTAGREASGPTPTQPLPSPPAPAIQRHRMLAVVAIAALVAVALWLSGKPARWGQPDYHTVAVLPFDALSESAVSRVMAEGFSIELANAMGRSRQMRVIGPISAKLASTLGDSPPEIGRQLKADIVVSGSIRRNDDELTVSSVVTQVATGHRLWSDVFDRNADQILSVQREVANAVAGALQHTLEGGEPSPRANMQSLDILVYDEYLLGRYYRVRRTREDLERALLYFDNALQLNPVYAPALRETAATHLLLSFYGDKPLAEALDDAEPFLERALELTPEDAELQAVIGLSHYYNGAPGIAEEFLLRAVDEHPNLAEAWMWLGLARQQKSNLVDALAAMEWAQTLEPLMVTSAVNRADALAWLGRDTEAIALLTNLAATATATETFGNRAQLFRALSAAYLREGHLVDAYGWAERALSVAPESALSQANMALTLAALGQFEQASETARAVYTRLAPGRGVMEYLELANIISPGIIPRDVVEWRLEGLQRLADAPEIEWRIANLDLGMAAYFEKDLAVATTTLRKALDGRTYPIDRTDSDLFYCTTLADALQRSGTREEAANQLLSCKEAMQDAKELGWNSVSLAVSEVRLAALLGDRQAAQQLLEGLYERGFRDLPLLLQDPILRSLEESSAYQALREEVSSSIDTAWTTISDRGD